MAFFLVLLLFVVSVGLAYAGLQMYVQWQRATKAETALASSKTQFEQLRNKYIEDIKRCKEYIAGIKAENERLCKWKGVADADAKAEEVLAAAKAAFEKASSDSNALTVSAQQQAASLLADANVRAVAQLSEAKDTANAEITDAKRQAKALRDESQAALDSATKHVAKIVEGATKKAEEIAGSAYQAMRDAALYERTVKAMKNVIKGYGDEYIVPPHSLLDGLADDFQHAQAGRELKNARECTKIMIRNKTAATCDYAEAARRETAVDFVIDAFNGKVDSILSRIKHDNAGTLAQEIHDAFALVNYNGKAFRNARITEEFMTARLDELKWGALAQQLAIQQRDEQRDAKEQAREEARATKERERALREAAKEEDTMRRAMAQAREQFEAASGEQKAMYEDRLQEMAERLREIEERKQRAISMAQQTKKGHVYVISNTGSFGDGVYKIGLTRRWDPHDRINELGGASVPFGFDVHAMILSEDAPALEQRLHGQFVLNQMNKVNRRKEFFRVPLKQIREEIESLGLNGVTWTMTAAAREYRETLATEELINRDPSKRDTWVKDQLETLPFDNGFLEPVETATDDE